MPPLQLTLDGDKDVIITRAFKAPPAAVYRAHIEPDLIRQWMIAMPGWSMPVCETDSRAGGAFRYEWLDENGDGFSITGEYIALTPDQMIEHVERMHIPDATPDNHIVTTFDAKGTGTLLTLKMALPDAGSRQQMLDMGAADGMEASFAALDALNL